MPMAIDILDCIAMAAVVSGMVFALYYTLGD